jgi:cytochrome c551/c552
MNMQVVNRRPGRTALLALLPLLGVFAIDHAGSAQSGAADARLIKQYCASCHNDEQWSGGLSLEAVDTAHVGQDAKMWEEVVRKVRTGMMPPAGEPRPKPAMLQAFAGSLERELDRAARGMPPPGNPGLRRLTRFEYGNVIRDLLALEDNVTSLLPPDNNSDGFDTNGETLGNSPALVEAYVTAAAKLARRAVGDREASVVQVDYRPPTGWSQERHVDTLPLGTRGGYGVRHEFPVDGEYEITIAVAAGVPFVDALPRGRRIYVAIDKAQLTPQE